MMTRLLRRMKQETFDKMMYGVIFGVVSIGIYVFLPNAIASWDVEQEQKTQYIQEVKAQSDMKRTQNGSIDSETFKRVYE